LRPLAKTWHLLPHDRGAVERLATTTQLPPIVAQLLLNRGLHETEPVRRFLDMPFRGLHPPELLPGASAAAERLHAAVRQGRKVCIYGDYDVDGLTGTAILYQTLRLLGAPVDYYVPHRLDEGYGLSSEALAQIAAAGASLVVTVDCGITSLAEAEEARRLGLELIVTDHHEFKERGTGDEGREMPDSSRPIQLPRADELVHPRLPGGNYPFGDLSGSGVAFKLAWALCQKFSGATRVTPQFRDFLVESVILAALGMVADCVPLQDENRICVRHGLARLKQTSSVGLQALIQAAGLGEKPDLCAADIGFAVAPRLNAAGRLGCARLVVDLFTTRSTSHAAELARYLNKQNEDRQRIERRILEEARDQIAGLDLDNTPALVLASRDWHAGVIGIVAGRLAEQYARPALLIAMRDEPAVGQGSGRSVSGFALHEALQACGDGLISHGGHAAAAGFKIAHSQVDAFRERFCAHAARHFQAGKPVARLAIDAELPLSVLTAGLVQTVARLEPYGAGNPRPLFLAGPVQIVGTPRKVGKGERHLQFRLQQQQTTLPAIGFNLAERTEELLSAGGQCCLVFTPKFNDWQGWRSIQLEVADFQPGARARLD
jgi:single-stranded-DNA-specific exonuclease